MRILDTIRLNVTRTVAVGLMAVAANLASPTNDAHSDGILSGNLLDFSGSSRLSTRAVVPSAPNYRFDDNSKALSAYKSGDFALAIQLWKEAAQEGDSFAEWMLGHMYRYGQGVAADDAAAFKHYRAVALKFSGDRSHKTEFFVTLDATYLVARYYTTGIADGKLHKQPDRAFRLFKKAAVNGHAAAQFEFGRFILEGIGTKSNPKVGRQWIMRSANNRHAPAMALMGTIYLGSEDSAKDRARGLMWYTLAKDNACPALNPEIFERYEEVYLDATADERSKAVNSALQWNQHNPVKAGQGSYRIDECNGS